MAADAIMTDERDVSNVLVSNTCSLDEIFAPDDEKCLLAIRSLKNRVIGSNRQKNVVFEQNFLLPKLLSLLSMDESPMELKREVSLVLGSLAKGTRQQVACLVASGAVQHLINSLLCDDVPFIEASLRCLRSIFLTDMAPIDALYESDKSILVLLDVLDVSPCTQQCVAVIFSRSCFTLDHQLALHRANIVTSLDPLLFSDSSAVQLPVLKCLAALCHENVEISSALMIASVNDCLVVDRIVHLLARENTSQVQLAAAKCLSNLCRVGTILASDPIVIFKAMPCLVRLCREECVLWSGQERVEALYTLAYLTEEDMDLQRLAADNNQCLRSLASCLHWSSNMEESSADLTKEEAELSDQLEDAALTALASLALNDEEIRCKVGTEVPFFECILRSGCDENANPKHLLAVCRCLHALSRSVEQLRTTFQDRPIWKSLLTMAQSPNVELAALASATLCNLCLDFSPCKAAIMEAGASEVLCSLTKREEPSLRLNGVWGLMNAVYRTDEKQKMSVMNSVGSEQFLRLLTESPPDSALVLRTLGLLRNLLSSDARTNAHFIDQEMTLHGAPVVQAIIYVLEGDYNLEAKELALCVLSNVAAGNSAKEFIMSNEDILRKITNYMMVSSPRLQIAATCCVWNLVHKDDNGCAERQSRLRDLGVYKMLQQMQSTNDSELYDKVKGTMQQFS